MKILTLKVTHSNWYRNCKNVRNRNGKICKTCPFRKLIEKEEKELLNNESNIN